MVVVFLAVSQANRIPILEKRSKRYATAASDMLMCGNKFQLPFIGLLLNIMVIFFVIYNIAVNM